MLRSGESVRGSLISDTNCCLASQWLATGTPAAVHDRPRHGVGVHIQPRPFSCLALKNSRDNDCGMELDSYQTCVKIKKQNTLLEEVPNDGFGEKASIGSISVVVVGLTPQTH